MVFYWSDFLDGVSICRTIYKKIKIIDIFHEKLKLNKDVSVNTLLLPETLKNN